MCQKKQLLYLKSAFFAITFLNRQAYCKGKFTTLTDKLSLFALKVLSNEIAPNYHVVHIFV